MTDFQTWLEGERRYQGEMIYGMTFIRTTLIVIAALLAFIAGTLLLIAFS